MFGIIRPCRNRLGTELRSAWLSHLCGMCLSLRDEHGHLSRLVTNYDGLVISAAVEAQSGVSRRTAGPCALRGMKSADVAIGSGARLAASVSLVLASLKIQDHVDDGDGLAGKVPWAGRAMAHRWAAKGLETASDLGFDASVMVDAVRRQPEVEAGTGLGSSVLVVTEPTETATGFAFAQTALIAGRPQNTEPLREVGRLFGRVAHLIDAAEDLEEDRASGAWNPLLVTGTSVEEAHRLCLDAVTGIRLALDEVEFTDSRLVHKLMVHELEESVIRVFGKRHQHPPGKPRWSDPGSGLWAYPRLNWQRRPRGCFEGCGAFLYMCGTCQFCCRDPFPGPWSDKRRDGCGGDCGPNCDCNCNSCDCCCCPCD
ncbi:DUF5685 family protein [Lentzea jiangxiensis]|uniref:Regulatory protein n=1 Tax=Lentzea jiangxiensis TaxID=641025 RepID=A0A1H0H2T1_9PSEU|nr:DUF5685 family protein [Lentzea jiangxiensis]SDO13400.1 hypothetical protein SAMN05421507_1011484 [Lentzea jiangxiensis]